MSDQKALLIRSNTTTKSGKRGVWHEFEEAKPYIQGIETNIDQQVETEVLNNLVSGVPSPWARARLFGFAFDYTRNDPNIQRTGLIKFYERLVSEWKGLLAVFALFPGRVTISEPIFLDEAENNDLYHLPTALGRMLFEDKDIWRQPEIAKTEHRVRPFIQLIYYNGQLIGGSSPYSLFFTAIDYRNLQNTADLPWFRDGAFVDPLPFLNNDQLQKLYLLVRNINAQFEGYIGTVNAQRTDNPSRAALKFAGLKEFLREFEREIAETGRDLIAEGTLDAELNFAPPYHPLFNISFELYRHTNGEISFQGDGEREAFDPNEILLQDEVIVEFKQTHPDQPLDRAAVHYLTVPNPEFDATRPPDITNAEKLYFPIPFSAKGMRLFKNELGDMLRAGRGRGDAKDHQLSGEIRTEDFKLIVKLAFVVDGKLQTPVNREYNLRPIEDLRHFVMWPDFISSKWTAYYYYSEFPRTAASTQLIPFFKDAATQDFLLDRHQQLVYDTTDSAEGLRTEKLVAYPETKQESTAHPYDIFRANKPLAGLEIRHRIDGQPRIGGYLLVKKPGDPSMGDKPIQDLSNQTLKGTAQVGIDFGSNNTAIQYRTENGDVHPVPFHNRRVMLVGSEQIDPENRQTALPNELLFFQNEEPRNGQVKSWVHEHPAAYLVEGMREQALVGGVPVFEPNVFIKRYEKYHVETNVGVLHHGMKWLNSPKDQHKKTAYLKALWLVVCADLYALGLQPTRLRWSYPGSFSGGERTEMGLVYKEVVRDLPMQLEGPSLRVDDGGEASTESEAVSNYVIKSGVTLDDRTLFVGMDIGGSTTDILLIAEDYATGQKRLMRQSSVRLAAGELSAAVKQSATFRRCLFQYHNSPDSGVNIPNIGRMMEDPATAPFFLNAIFDRLTLQQFDRFYGSIARCGKGIFVVPAYITGLLVFYAGQLVALTKRENDFLAGVERVTLFPFGKGGRIFDWLDEFPGSSIASEYYTECFRAGFGEKGANISFDKTDSDALRRQNKSEVAIGLVREQEIAIADNARSDADVFGETGFQLRDPSGENPVPVPEDAIARPELFENLSQLIWPREYERFGDFLEIFCRFVGPETGLFPNVELLKSKREELPRLLKGHIESDPEYVKARHSDAPFDYRHSMLVLEGMVYLEKVLIPEVYRS